MYIICVWFAWCCKFELRSLLCTYVYERRHRQLEVVSEISGVRLDLAGNLVLFSRITEINSRVDTTNLGERHFYRSVDHRLLVIASILAGSSRERSQSRSRQHEKRRKIEPWTFCQRSQDVGIELKDYINVIDKYLLKN